MKGNPRMTRAIVDGTKTIQRIRIMDSISITNIPFCILSFKSTPYIYNPDLKYYVYII